MTASISKTTLNFLAALKNNNNREWFNLNKSQFELAKSDFIGWLRVLIPEISKFDSELGAPEPEECIFRIYRDVRFSTNKDPYKANFGAYIARGGRKSHLAGYYFHLEPGASFVSGGIYMAPAAILMRMRRDIEVYQEEFLAIVNAPEFKKTFDFFEDSKLKRVPQGFDKESPVAEYLKLRDLTPFRMLSDEAITSSSMQEESVKYFHLMSPLVTFINQAINLK